MEEDHSDGYIYVNILFCPKHLFIYIKVIINICHFQKYIYTHTLVKSLKYKHSHVWAQINKIDPCSAQFLVTSLDLNLKTQPYNDRGPQAQY